MSNSSGEVFYPSYDTCVDGLTPQCPVSATIYGYRPTLGPTILFSIIFSVCVILQIIFGIRLRGYAFLVWMFFGVALETTGWWARVALWQDVWNYSAMISSLTGLIMGPSFINGAISVTFKHIILYTGEQHSTWLRAKWFPVVFIGTDFLAIFIQAAGAGLSAGATSGTETNRSLLDISSAILIAGVAFQLANMVLCGAYLVYVAWNYRKARKTRSSTEVTCPYDEAKQLDGRARFRFRFFVSGLCLAYFTIIVRCAFRVPEMVDGWGGKLMQDEPTFFGLEGTMLAIACISLTVAHPVFFFPPMQQRLKAGQPQEPPQSSDGEVEKASPKSSQ